MASSDRSVSNYSRLLRRKRHAMRSHLQRLKESLLIGSITMALGAPDFIDIKQQQQHIHETEKAIKALEQDHKKLFDLVPLDRAEENVSPKKKRKRSDTS